VKGKYIGLCVNILAALLMTFTLILPMNNTTYASPLATRQPCSDHNVFRKPLFGDTHVHTSFSFDAALLNTFNDPRDALRFAKGETLSLPDANGAPTRRITIDRPLDFVAITDHSEYFGEVKICITPGSVGYDSPRCQLFRNKEIEVSLVNTIWTTTTIATPNPVRFPFCFEDGQGGQTQEPLNCLANATTFWDEIQAAAEEAYDRTSDCSFTSFIAYEWTGTPGGDNTHRNVIFRNEQVPALPVSYLETSNNPSLLWSSLQTECLDVGTGCDVLTISHNNNLSNGSMFQVPTGTIDERIQEATTRQFFEPLSEIIQHKGGSECRLNVQTNDEACGFEQMSLLNFAQASTDPSTFQPNSFIRNVLKEGLVQEQELGINPFKIGLVGSTDTHNGAPGSASEATFQGHDGSGDATVETLLHEIERGPGGLAVAWAEENSRDAIFDAMRRRETYATSGTRPILRFFGGWTYPENLCSNPAFVKIGYAQGVPMGSDLPPKNPSRTTPRFAVMAMQDSGTASQSGTQLQRIQIIKGWVDNTGAQQEQVFDVAGTNNDAYVDPQSCDAIGEGASSLCAMFDDPDFDPDQPAFYYARVLENPSCRWSARACQSVNLNPFDSAACTTELNQLPEGTPEEVARKQTLSACCSMVPGPNANPANAEIPATIQERAWSSPIWYRPNS